MAGTAGNAISREPQSRRDFLSILVVTTSAIGLGATAWPLIDAIGPGADGISAARSIVDIAGISENTGLAVRWAGLPIYIRRLTKKQVADNRYVVAESLPDPASFTDRVKPGYENWVVVVGLNTGSPCLLEGNSPSDTRGTFDGWLCPCDGSVYDPLGRVRSGPAKRNLAIPRFKFLNDAQIQFG